MVGIGPERTPLQSAPWQQWERDTVCLQFSMVDGVQPVIQHHKPLTSMENLPLVEVMVKAVDGPIRFISSKVNASLHTWLYWTIKWPMSQYSSLNWVTELSGFSPLSVFLIQTTCKLRSMLHRGFFFHFYSQFCCAIANQVTQNVAYRTILRSEQATPQEELSPTRHKKFWVFFNICPTNSETRATCRKANSIQDPASHFQGYSRSLSFLYQWTYNCQTQIYLWSPLKQQYSAATSYTENAAYTWCSLLCCCCPCALEQIK